MIINQVKFQKDGNRNGSENDVDRLKLLFGLLNYEVLEPEKDLDENDLMKTFDNFVTYINNSSYNSLVLVIMSHGSRDEENRDYIIDKKGNKIYVIFYSSYYI